MRVLFVNDYGYLFGGAEVHGSLLAQALGRRGHEVQWLTSDVREGSTLFRLPGPPVAIHKNYFCGGTGSGKRLRRGLRQMFSPSAWRSTQRALKEFDPQVVHLHSFLGQLSPWVLEPLEGVPVVASAQTYKPICPRATKLLPDGALCTQPFGRNCLSSGCLSVAEYGHEALKRRLYERWFHRIHTWIAPSRYVQALMEREWGGRVTVIPNGTDFARYREKKRNRGDTILFAGRLDSTKGVNLLLYAFAEMRKRLGRGQLIVAGNGPEETRLWQLAADLGIADEVRFEGYCSRKRLAHLHAESDLLAAPAQWAEPMGITLVEALAAGTPVVATAVGGHTDIVESGVNGLLVPVGDPEALAAAMGRILEDGSLRERLESEALKSAPPYAIDSLVDPVLGVYLQARQNQSSVGAYPHDPALAWSFRTAQNPLLHR